MEHVCIELPHRALQELGGALGSGFVMLLSDFRSKLGLEKKKKKRNWVWKDF